MILRKPYAFIIKHFKLLHLILTVLLGISVYRISYILNFLKEYLNSPVVLNKYDTVASLTQGTILDEFDSLFPMFVFILPLITVLVTIVLLFILYTKKKPLLLYIIVILYSIAILVVYAIGYSLVGEMQKTIVDIRFTSIIKDAYSIMMFVGIGISVLTLVRATGFDIKKFNFVKDLQELDITEEDNEEFELELNVDSNVIRRNLRKKLRHLKYKYIEKKFVINLGIVISLVVIGFIVYFVILVHHETFSQNSTFGSSDFTIHINNTYVTNRDYAGNIITDNYLVILDVNVRSAYANGKKLDIGNCILTINDREYKHTTKYRDLVYDIGNVYEDNYITNKETNYLLVYEIPSNYIKKNMVFRYTMSLDLFASTMRPKYAKVKLNPVYLEEGSKTSNYELADKISFSDSVMENLSVLINNYEINSIMAEYYRFCISTKECYDSVEYITPGVGNIEKTILKLNGKIENNNVSGIYNLYNLVSKFGKVEYTIGNVKKKASVADRLTPIHSSTDTYYLEIPKEIEKADTISLVFNVRNRSYEYILKTKEG